MRKHQPNSGVRNSLSLATMCAVVVATSCAAAGVGQLSSPDAVAAESRLVAEFEQAEVVRRIDAYCRASWKNSRIDEGDWEDSTQDVFARLLSSLSRLQLRTAIEERDSTERRELNRAIWATAQRRRREIRLHELPDYADPAASADPWQSKVAQLQSIVTATDSTEARLSPTQRAIIRSSTEGKTVNEIASQLSLSPVRVSDEKYKATQKLRRHLSDSV